MSWSVLVTAIWGLSFGQIVHLLLCFVKLDTILKAFEIVEQNNFRVAVSPIWGYMTLPPTLAIVVFSLWLDHSYFNNKIRNCFWCNVNLLN